MPVLPQHHVNRPHLAKKLEEGVKEKFITVVAPAGFGKTVGVAQWLRKKSLPAGWISLDSADNNLFRFWRYLAAALDHVLPGTRQHMFSYLHPEGNLSSPESLEDAATCLIDQLERYPGDFALVLDDYHLLQSPRSTKAWPFCSSIPRTTCTCSCSAASALLSFTPGSG